MLPELLPSVTDFASLLHRHHKIPHDEVFAFRGVLAHVEGQVPDASCLGAYSTWLNFMPLPMNCGNSLGLISPRPLKRVISQLLPSLALAASR